MNLSGVNWMWPRLLMGVVPSWKISYFINLGAIIWICWSVWLRGNRSVFNIMVDPSIGAVMRVGG